MTPQFKLEKAEAKFTHINVRLELHGEDRVPAVDLDLEHQTTSDVLIAFASDLRSSLFKHDPGSDLASQGQPDNLNALRFPQIGSIKWAGEQINQTVVLHYGVSKNDVTLLDCRVRKFVLTPQAGGIVTVGFQVTCTPDEKTIARLSSMLGSQVTVTLGPDESVQEAMAA